MGHALHYDRRLRRYPPILCRLLTRRGAGVDAWAPTDSQIAEATGLSLPAVKRISWSTSWDDITNGERKKFLAGCDIELERPSCLHRLEWMRTQGTFTHLKRSPLWRTQLQEMVEIWLELLDEE